MKAKLLILLAGIAIGQWLTLDDTDETVPEPHPFPHTIEFDREIMHVPFARKIQVI